ncbi:AMP-binding protein [Nocardioides sp. LHD-245]|uniref:class I adenylate-forming enzyme family protein n=1 Tax=Nocardioides sp. LHD-245 TaxID=3051387 RepID=UPI0027E1FFB4|nr:AMP-binding protein [Nocardioides sp. LHD-245]
MPVTGGLGATMQVSLGESITNTARNTPDRASFLYTDGTTHSFAQTNARVNRLVSVLRGHGIGPGDRVAVFALDSHGYVEIVLAAAKLGATYVPLNYRLTRPEVDVLLARSQPVALFYDTRYAELLEGVAEDQPALRLLVRIDASDPGRVAEYEELLASGVEDEPPVVATDADLIGLAFTSGTTGLPKGVLQSQRQVKAIVNAQIVEYRMRPGEVRYTAAPAFHISGICQLLAGVMHGFTSLVMPQFDARATLDQLVADELTAVFLVPTMISTMLQLPDVHDHDYARLELMYYGASSMSPALLRRAMDTFDCDFLNAFGAGTEAGLQAVLRPEDHRRALAGEPALLGSIGKPSYGVSMRLVDGDMNDVPQGQVGEIATRSDMVFDGYLDMPEETARATRDGWFRAGDMAYVDDNGYLYLNGRSKDMIVRGGENIYPFEIEAVLSELPDVVQVAVVGVEDEHWGEIVRAWVVLSPESGLSEMALRAHCAARLARYKVPAEFRFEPELPVNASGKILKRELRTRA